MNREKQEKKRTKKDIIKNHACTDGFEWQGLRALHDTGRRRNRAQKSLLQLPVQPARRRRGGRTAPSNCGGIMDAVAVWARKDGEWANHSQMSALRKKAQLESGGGGHNPMKLMSIAMKPLASPPFPLERIEEMDAADGRRRKHDA
jgi:hypothetical protein